MTTGPHEVYSIPGAVTPDSITIATGIPTDSPSLYLAYTTTPPSTTAGWPDPTLCAFVPLDTDGASFPMAQTTLSSLAPGTRYYAGVCGGETTPVEWYGDPIQFKTLYDSIPEDGSVTVNWAYGSCQYHWQHNPTDGSSNLMQPAWDDLAGPNAFQINDILWDTGDFHYQGGQPGDPDWSLMTEWGQLYWDQLHHLPLMRRARALIAEDQISDDHEFSSNNGESHFPASDLTEANDPFYRGTARMYQMQSTPELFAMYPLEDDAVGMYGSYMLTPHVRVIILDCESLQRSYSQGPGYLNFLGEAQFTWLKGLLTPKQGETIPTLNLIIAGKTYIGDDWTNDPTNPYNDNERDKVWWYHDWRDDFATFLAGLTGPQVNIVWMGGDRHWCCWDDGTYNNWGGFPCLVGSGWSQKTLHLVPGESYTYKVPQPDPSGQRQQVFQYLCGAITDHANGDVEFDTTIRYWDATNEAMTSFEVPVGGPPMMLPFPNPNIPAEDDSAAVHVDAPEETTGGEA